MQQTITASHSVTVQQYLPQLPAALDASIAFDKVRYDKLFIKLSNVP